MRAEKTGPSCPQTSETFYMYICELFISHGSSNCAYRISRDVLSKLLLYSQNANRANTCMTQMRRLIYSWIGRRFSDHLREERERPSIIIIIFVKSTALCGISSVKRNVRLQHYPRRGRPVMPNISRT